MSNILKTMYLILQYHHLVLMLVNYILHLCFVHVGESSFYILVFILSYFLGLYYFVSKNVIISSQGVYAVLQVHSLFVELCVQILQVLSSII